MPPRRPTDPHWDRLVRFAETEVDRLVARLPGPLREQASRLPVSYTDRPTPEMIADGLDADLLGLFVGLGFRDLDSGAQDLPAQIFLFLDNIWSFCEGDMVAYREEVARTYLHELGHYLGLDEDDLFDRDLD